MSDRAKPKSLEGRWDILYRDYPEVYDEWEQVPKVPDLIEVMVARFPIKGKRVVDIGAGTGLSTFKLARHAHDVIGVEIEPSMRALAIERAKAQSTGNVRFELGDAEHLPLEDASVGAAFAITLADLDPVKTASEMERIVQPGGMVLRADVAPGWYGGNINRRLSGEPAETAPLGSRDAVLTQLGYDFMDIYMDQVYKGVDHLVETYGFIHSERAIKFILKHKLTRVRWKFRVRFKMVA